MSRFVVDTQAMRDGLARTATLVALDYGKKVERMARSIYVPVDTGALRTSLSTELDHQHGEPYTRVGSILFYAGWVHRGTGLYGPHHQRIYPRRARYLRFTLKNGQVIVTPSVRGQKAQPYLTDALKAVFR